MARRLRFTVAVNGNVYPAGTDETDELAEQITNDAAWEGKAGKESKSKDEDSEPAKPSRSRKSH